MREPGAVLRWLALVGLTVFPGLGMSGCGHLAGGSSALVVDVEADRETGIPGTPFGLRGVNRTPDRRVVSWRWDLGDGSTASGPEAFVAYAAPGTYAVAVTGRDTRGSSFRAGLVLTVFDPSGNAPGPAGVVFPARPGDADADGDVDPADVDRILDHARLLVQITDPAGLAAADVDHDGAVTEEDARLVSLALAAGNTFPDELSPAAGPPGIAVRLLSPLLLDPAVDFRVQVGAAAAFPPYRPALGYASFFVPLDAGGGDPRLGVAPGPIDIVLLGDGVPVATYSFDLTAPPPLPSDADERLVAMFAGLYSVLLEGRATLASYLGALAATPEESASLLAFVDLAAQDLAPLAEQVRAGLSSLAPQVRELFLLIAQANGLEAAAPTLLAGRTSLSGNTPGLPGDTLAEDLCRLHRMLEALGILERVFGMACSLAQVSALVPGPQQPLLLALAAACRVISTASDVLGVLRDFLPKPGESLVVEAQPPALSDGETAEIRVKLPVQIWDQLCTVAGGKLKDKFANLLIMRLLRAPAARSAFEALESALVVDLVVRQEFMQRLEDLIGSILGEVFKITGLDELWENELRAKICSFYNPLNPHVELEPSGVLGPASPANAGTLAFGPAGSGQPATYTCIGVAGAATVFIPATKQLCTELVTGSVRIECGARDQIAFVVSVSGEAHSLMPITLRTVDNCDDAILDTPPPATITCSIINCSIETSVTQKGMTVVIDASFAIGPDMPPLDAVTGGPCTVNGACIPQMGEVHAYWEVTLALGVPGQVELLLAPGLTHGSVLEGGSMGAAYGVLETGGVTLLAVPEVSLAGKIHVEPAVYLVRFVLSARGGEQSFAGSALEIAFTPD